MKYDAIIVGSGLGGLTVGALLAKEGKKVMIVEQHNIAGGCATVFKRKGYTMDAGLHEMDGLAYEDQKTHVFKELDVFNNVEFIRVPEFYRFINGRVDITVPDNYRLAETEFIRHFPAEAAGIKKFMHAITSIKKESEPYFISRPDNKLLRLVHTAIVPFAFPNVFRHRNGNTGDFLDSIIKDEDLKLALLGNLMYYSDNPYALAMVYFGSAQGGYYLGGSHYVKGGSQNLSNYFVNYITERKGEIILGHMVTKIIVENNKAAGIEFVKTGQSNIPRQAYARQIVCNAAIPNVAGSLLPPEQSDNLKDRIKGIEPSCSLLSVYYCFKKKPELYGCKHYSTFVLDPAIQSLKDLNYKMDYNKRSFVFVDFGQIDSGLAPEGKSVGTITTPDYLDSWDSLEDEAYKAKKQQVADIFADRLDRLYPGIKDAIDHIEVATPKTIKRYTLNPAGTPYGFAQTKYHVGFKRLQNISNIENLHFASAWSVPGGGFTGTILSGYYCAREILKEQ